MSGKRLKPALQKADTEWKTDCQTRPVVFSPVRTGLQAVNRIIAPVASTVNVQPMIDPIVLLTSLVKLAFTALVMERLWPRPTPCPMKRAKKAKKLISPSPPTWMSESMTACPKGVKTVAVSTTVRPVTHTADVAVNKASRGSIPFVAAGRRSRPVPVRIIAASEMGSIAQTRTWLMRNDPMCCIRSLAAMMTTLAWITMRITRSFSGQSAPEAATIVRTAMVRARKSVTQWSSFSLLQSVRPSGRRIAARCSSQITAKACVLQDSARPAP